MMSVDLKNIAILNIQGVDYYCISKWISKYDAINLLLNIDLTKRKQEIVKKYFFLYHIWKCIKFGEKDI